MSKKKNNRISRYNVNALLGRYVMRIKVNNKQGIMVVDPMTNSQNSHHKNCITDINIWRITNEILGLKGLGRVQPTFTSSKRYSVRINQFGIGRT